VPMKTWTFCDAVDLLDLLGRSPALRACLRGGLSDFVAGQCMLCALWCRLVSLW
jgi:hypothetical protein